ncbi:MAG: F0F1 ATP synthase subunit alpha [Hahellaceae bacterium]|nr:F0F1 ATP synthase subunit alpha [Hahellaceae bacterium]
MNPLARNNYLGRTEAWVHRYQPRLKIRERGVLVSVGDGVAWVEGLPSARMGEMLAFADGSIGLVLDLSEHLIGAVMLRQSDTLMAGCEVLRTGRPLGLWGSDLLLGRIIDPLGGALDSQGGLSEGHWMTLDLKSPAIIERAMIHEPLYTGYRMIDAMIPIGKGQRQLIIGDEGLGRSSLALGTVLNQRGRSVRCIYVSVGQKRTEVIRTLDTLQRGGGMPYTTVVSADAGAPAGMQYLAPFTGAALGTLWMRQGHDVLVIYDDLSAHANSYRELSLLLRRPPGREAYPGDVFSIHARLLEQATCLAPEHGGGSLTALPIAVTQQGEISAYIPTNLISITDGQIYLTRQLFAAGFRPAIDIGRSVSRIGGKAQHPAIRKEAGRMKLDYSRFLELEVFTTFGARLEASMEKIIQRGKQLRELLKQERLELTSPQVQLAWLIAYNEGWLDSLPAQEMKRFLARLAAEPLSLTLDTPRDQWKRWLQPFLKAGGER